jgi:hypothetical protein
VQLRLASPKQVTQPDAARHAANTQGTVTMSNDDEIGTYYFVPHRPKPVELLANPPYAAGTDYEPACGTGAFLVEAAKHLTPAPR